MRRGEILRSRCFKDGTQGHVRSWLVRHGIGASLQHADAIVNTAQPDVGGCQRALDHDGAIGRGFACEELLADPHRLAVGLHLIQCAGEVDVAEFEVRLHLQQTVVSLDRLHILTSEMILVG